MRLRQLPEEDPCDRQYLGITEDDWAISGDVLSPLVCSSYITHLVSCDEICVPTVASLRFLLWHKCTCDENCLASFVVFEVCPDLSPIK